MNERIEQLLLQVAPRAGEDGEYLPSLHTPQDIERFAELLIRECVTKMALEIMDEQWVDDAVKNTYIHFGVEE